MTRASLALNMRRSIERLPKDHYARPKALRDIELLESTADITPQTMNAMRQNADWYTDYLERVHGARAL
jgi:hypothetical protein